MFTVNIMIHNIYIISDITFILNFRETMLKKWGPFLKKKTTFRSSLYITVHVQTNTSNITWTSKSFLWKKAPLFILHCFTKKKIIRIFQAEIMQEPTVEKRCTWLHGPLMNKLIGKRYISCYLFPGTTLSLNKKEKLHGSWFLYWLQLLKDVILPNKCIF